MLDRTVAAGDHVHIKDGTLEIRFAFEANSDNQIQVVSAEDNLGSDVQNGGVDNCIGRRRHFSPLILDVCQKCVLSQGR